MMASYLLYRHLNCICIIISFIGQLMIICFPIFQYMTEQMNIFIPEGLILYIFELHKMLKRSRFDLENWVIFKSNIEKGS